MDGRAVKIKLPRRWRLDIQRVWNDYRAETVPRSVQIVLRREPVFDPDQYNRKVSYVTTKIETPNFYDPDLPATEDPS